MSEEQLKSFLEKVKADTSLREKLKGAADADAALAITKEAGFMISTDDLKNAQSEISDEELEAAAGGYWGQGTLDNKPTDCYNFCHSPSTDSTLRCYRSDGCSRSWSEN